jgi:hypothetical protein
MAADARSEHLDRLVRTWLGVGADAAVPPLPAPLARRLLRDEERERPARDGWGNWEFGLCEAFADGTLWEPAVDRWLAAQEQGEPRWPGGAPFAVCLTHDVDIVAAGYSTRQALRLVRARATAAPGEHDAVGRAVRAAGAATALLWQRGGRAPDAGPVLEACTAIERESGVRGSYFVPVHAGRATNPYDVCVYALEDRCTWHGRETTVAAVLRELVAEGFDVGLHGSYASATDGALLRAERERLADALRTEVTTTRQHWLHWEIAGTPARQEAAGLRADSTLGFNRNVGFRAGTSLPFRWWDEDAGRALDLIQLPLVVQEAALTAANALELDRAGAIGVWERLLGAVAETGGVATLLVHPHALADPTVDALYRQAVAEAVRAGAWVATLAQIDEHWRAREARLGLAP